MTLGPVKRHEGSDVLPLQCRCLSTDNTPQHNPSFRIYTRGLSTFHATLVSISHQLTIGHGVIIVFIARNLGRSSLFSYTRPLQIYYSRGSLGGPLKVCFSFLLGCLVLTWSSRFILNLPDEELSSLERICFQVEQACAFLDLF